MVIMETFSIVRISRKTWKQTLLHANLDIKEARYILSTYKKSDKTLVFLK